MNARHIAGTVSGPGTQTVELERYRSSVSDRYYFEVTDITGSGTLTLASRLSADGAWSAIEGGSIDLSSPLVLSVDGPMQAVRVTPSASGDEWTLTVYQA